MWIRRRVARVFFLAVVGVGCRSEESTDVRGTGLRTQTLPPAEQAKVYRAALSAAFHLDDPGLSLLVDPRFLPRGSGVGDGPPMTGDVVRALHDQGTVRGTCQAPPEGTRKTINCGAPRPGYVVRFSEVFRLAADSVQVYVGVQKYDTPESGATEALQFENVYQVVRHDGDWSAAREARIKKRK